MCVEIEVDDSALKSCACALIEMEACACDLCGCLRIENAEVIAESPMCLGLKIKLLRLADAADLNVAVRIRAVRD